MSLKAIGRSIPQLESGSKVTGRGQYTHDVSLPGMLYACVLRSPHAAARIEGIDAEAARAMPGVACVITAADFSDNRYVNFGPAYADRYPMARDVVRFHGEEVAAVAAETPQQAWAAAQAIAVGYTAMPAATSLEAALAPDAPEIHPAKPNLPRNVAQLADARFGDVDKAMQSAVLSVEGSFRHGIVWPVCMETNATVARFDAASGELEVWCGTQAPFFVRKELAQVIGLPLGKIKVRSVLIGGGFGGKSQAPEQIAIAAMLAVRCGRPVKLVLSRDEEYLAGKTDHAKVMHLKTAVDADGNIVARFLEGLVDNGAYTHMGPVYVSAMRQRLLNLYRVQSAEYKAKLVYTNKVPGGSYRGMGAPGIIWALETQIDEIADKLGLDPVEYRKRIANRPGDVTQLGWKITSCALADCIQRAADLIGWEQKRGKLPKYRGIGIASMIHPSGSVLYPEGNFSNVALTAQPDGRFLIGTQTADAGTGQNTILAQLVADKLELPVELFDVLHMDTEQNPDDLGSAASRVTFVTGNAALNAGGDLLTEFKRRLAEDWSVSPDAIAYAGGIFAHPADASQNVGIDQLAQRYGSIRVEGHYAIDQARPDANGFGNYAVSYAFAAQAVEVEVDPETGHVRVLNVASVQDVGRVLNPTALEGQTYGGIMQGIGMALSEEVLFQDGKPVNRSLINYRVPRIADTPHIAVEFIETSEELGPFGAKAAGEPTINATIAAVANAVANAVGHRFHTLPITPEAVLAVLRAREPKPALKPYKRPYNAEVAAVRAAYPAMFPAMQKLGAALGHKRPRIGSFDLRQADNLQTALDTLGETANAAKLIGGGTDLLPGIRQGVYAPALLLSCAGLPGMRDIAIDGRGTISIGAAVTLSQLQNHAGIRQWLPGLYDAIGQIATLQVRNRATVAGDLCQEKRCWFFRSATPCYRFSGPSCPCYAVLGESRHHSIIGAGRCAAPCVSDLAPILTALGACLHVVGPQGNRVVLVEDLYVWAGETVLRRDEIITRIEIPAAAGAFHYEKYARWRGDFAESAAAVSLSGDRNCLRHVRISLGGVAPKPVRAMESEKLLLGAGLSQARIRAAAEAAVHGALPLKDNHYKTTLTIAVVGRAIAAALDALPVEMAAE